ncbi:MAG: hypothetical protein IKE70_00895, partial [Bacilli bacterium]|nr:hypothetical protein [Bacilli bacterium]
MYNYLLESEDSLSLQKEIKKIVKENQFKEEEIIHYDLEEIELEKALEDLDTYSFLTEKKGIVIDHLESLKQEENKKEIEHLLKYIENPNPDYLLILTARKLNNTYKLTKELKKKCKYIQVEINLKSFIKEELKEYKINDNTISFLIEY